MENEMNLKEKSGTEVKKRRLALKMAQVDLQD
jgi:hypothetical protein